MILPLGDQPNPKGTPWVTYGLLALNVAVFLLITLPLSSSPVDPRDPRLREYLSVFGQGLPPGISVRDMLGQMSAYDLFVFSFGYRPSDPSLIALMSSMFLHAGFLHLFGNMLFLWIYADNVEHRLGALPFLGWYLATGAAATLFHALGSPNSPIPLVGASGAISGVLGFYFLWFPRNKVRLWVLLFPFFMEVILVPARWVLGFYLVVDNLLPFVFGGRGMGGGVAHGAHIGGFLAGLAAAWLVNRRQEKEPVIEFTPEARRVSSEESAHDHLAGALRRGDFPAAAELYFSIPAGRARGILSPADSIELGEWLFGAGHPTAALTVFQRHLRDYPRGPGLGEAHAHIGLIQLDVLGRVTPAYQHLVEALDYDLPASLERVIREALLRIAGLQKGPFRGSVDDRI
ncbi:MAG: rhomboid family intramembrane serine protease [Verrucomicrobia bacterium]|nr:rhomboid family intramembrane serine protease [Verrucomicrobiota bacterium]